MRRAADPFTVTRITRLLEASAALPPEPEASVVFDFTEPEVSAMSHSFSFDFEQVPLIPGTDSYMTGVADIQYDADGDWQLVGIMMASASIFDTKAVPVDRSGMLYQHIASRIEIHCRQDIDDAVREVMAERRDEGRHLLAAE